MKARLVCVTYVFTLLAGAVPWATAQDESRLFLWKARSNSNAVYLLGSIHVANEGFYPMPAEVEKAFADATVLAVEVDLTKIDQGAMQETLLAKGTYEGTDSLGKHVPAETLKNVRAYFATRGMPPDTMEKFKPWALSITITMLEMQALGYKAELGIDKHFMERKGERRVVQLESADEQINLLSGFPDKLQAEFLASTIESVDEAEELMSRTVGAWKTGNVAALEEILIAGPLAKRPDLKGVYAKLFDERNKVMAGKIETLLKAKEPAFVVVGAAHLIGKNGILKLLEKQGYFVEQVARGDGNAVKTADAGGPEAGRTVAAGPDAAAPAAQVPAAEKKPAKRGYAPADAWKK